MDDCRTIRCLQTVLEGREKDGLIEEGLTRRGRCKAPRPAKMRHTDWQRHLELGNLQIQWTLLAPDSLLAATGRKRSCGCRGPCLLSFASFTPIYLSGPFSVFRGLIKLQWFVRPASRVITPANVHEDCGVRPSVMTCREREPVASRRRAPAEERVERSHSRRQVFPSCVLRTLLASRVPGKRPDWMPETQPRFVAQHHPLELTIPNQDSDETL